MYKIRKFALGRAAKGESISFTAAHILHPVKLRNHTSDAKVFFQVLIDREYGCLDGANDPKLIIDCGANIGLSSAYLLSRYPRAKLIAIEPDPANFRQLELNMAPYGDRCTLIRAGIWSKETGLVVEQVNQGDEWGVTVREAKPGETADVPAVDLGTLLKRSGEDRIDILKVDIEGSELEVFTKNAQSWIDKFDNLAIELHGPECESGVMAALAHRHMTISYSGELTVFKRSSQPAS